VPRPEGLYQWAATVASRFPTLSRPQAFALALWSFGLVLARSCGLSSVALALAPLLGRPDNTLRQRLREFYQEAGRKRGPRRRQLDPAACAAPLLAWVVSGWGGRRLALALDATALAGRLTVLAASVLYRGCAIPVAWAVLPGNEPGAWLPHWRALLARLRAALDGSWTVVVLTDRGLESAELFRAVAALGWHPLMRARRSATSARRGGTGSTRWPPSPPDRGRAGPAPARRTSGRRPGWAAPCWPAGARVTTTAGCS